MKKEEAIKILQNIYFEVPEIKEALQIAIEALSKPSLPSNLDKAAEEYAGVTDAFYHQIEIDAFKAGAEWMAAQGATCNGEIQMDFSEPDDIYARRLSADYWNELGPALMKVEPGKVLIQIRKK